MKFKIICDWPDEFSLSNEVNNSSPTTLTTALPLYPPDPQVYEGTYMLAQLSTLKIVTYEQQLLLTISSQGAATQSVYLAYKEPLQLQVKTASFRASYTPHCPVSTGKNMFLMHCILCYHISHNYRCNKHMQKMLYPVQRCTSYSWWWFSAIIL